MKSSQEINDIKLWSTVILAAGKGTRMNSDTPMVVLDLNGKPIIIWGLELITQLGFTDITVVTGHKADLVESVIKKDFQNISFCRVEELLGTAHSLQQALPHISPNSKNILVLFGDDLALYSPSSICEFVNYHQNNDNKVTFLTLLKKRPTELGGLEKDEDGNVIGVLTKSMQEERKLKSH
jgi:bifunctional UDP-N-acetylglucosamine pyrophosphorylase/glucosamine-1-phosphate N-acetyltransferase